MATDSSSSGSQRLRSGSETPTAAATARRPSAFSTLSSASSSAGSWSRASAASTDQSFPSRTSSNAAFVPRPSSPNRDSFISIVDDPFFQHLDSLDTPTSVVPDSYKPIEFESETLAEIPFFSPETPRSNRYDHEGQQQQHWPPPRRESLTIGSSQFWVGHVKRMKKLQRKEKKKNEQGRGEKSQDIDCPCLTPITGQTKLLLQRNWSVMACMSLMQLCRQADQSSVTFIILPQLPRLHPISFIQSSTPAWSVSRGSQPGVHSSSPWLLLH